MSPFIFSIFIQEYREEIMIVDPDEHGQTEFGPAKIL